jgi:predicted amidophosphoribosyltransferase
MLVEPQTTICLDCMSTLTTPDGVCPNCHE